MNMRFLVLSALAAGSACRPEANAAWWKGNLHTHSLWSDGDDFPERIVDRYKKAGYDFVALSDHNVLAEGERLVEAPGPVVADYRDQFGENWVEVGADGRVRLKTLSRSGASE